VLHKASRIRGAAIRATDGEIGTLEDFYFEEDRWVVRYLLVDTGKWLSGRRVLLSPMSVSGEWNMAEIPVALTRDQVWHSPEFDHLQPISRQRESQLLRHYGYPDYWDAGGVWGTHESPASLRGAPASAPAAQGRTSVDLETHPLLSTKDIISRHLHATDGEIGHVDDVLIGQETWRIRYLQVDTSNWIGGKWVIVSTEALRGVDREHRTLRVGLTRAQIHQSPSFESIETMVGAGETGPPFVII
jgi:hypothetical protein